MAMRLSFQAAGQGYPFSGYSSTGWGKTEADDGYLASGSRWRGVGGWHKIVHRFFQTAQTRASILRARPGRRRWGGEEDEALLQELFKHQAELNRRIGFDPEALRKEFDHRKAGEWINNYLMAMANELEELRDCTYWKHWCAEAKAGRRFELHDLQNARVEVIDLLFFWISLAQCVGMDAADVMDLYQQKLKVNHQRQETGYSMTGKDETDNKSIQLKRE